MTPRASRVVSVALAAGLLAATPASSHALQLLVDVRLVAADTLRDVAATASERGRPTIYYNPALLERVGPRLARFLIAHEYGHVAAGHTGGALAAGRTRFAALRRAQELEADCYAAVRLDEDGSAEAVIQFFARLGPFRFDDLHPVGHERAAHVTACRAAALPPPPSTLHPPTFHLWLQPPRRYVVHIHPWRRGTRMTSSATLVSPSRTGGDSAPSRLSGMASALVGSEILKIAAEIRAMREAGDPVADFTVGDFDPAQFRIPPTLAAGIEAALRRGHTNYPPSSGVRPLREAVAAWHERTLGVRCSPDTVLITSGSRPGIYGTYRTLVDPGDRVVYPVPSWNNNHYCRLVGAVDVPVRSRREDAFLPTRELLGPAVRGARLLALNSPLNPAGTAFTAEQLGGICDLVLEENARRGPGERPLFLMYDQVYRTLTFGGVTHVDPVSLRPAMAPYTVYVDGISKAFAATGVRVGWVIGPADVTAAMSNVLAHVGAWAPHAEQIATAEFLSDAAAVSAFQREFVAGVSARLQVLNDGIAALRGDGLPADSVAPAGAIYLSVRFALNGTRAPGGASLGTNEEIRHYLLERAGVAVVPFQAFGSTENDGWFRLSVGAVSVESIERAIPRLRAALEALRD